MLYLVTSITEAGAADAHVVDVVDGKYAAETFGLADADVYVAALKDTAVFRAQTSLAELTAAQVSEMHPPAA